MLHIFADGITKRVKNNLPGDKHRHTNNNIPKRPAIVEGTQNEQ